MHSRFSLLIGVFLFATTLPTVNAQSYKAIAAEGDVTISNAIAGTRPLRAGDPIPYGSTITTGPNGGAIIQKGNSFTIVQITNNTRVRIDYKGLQQLSKLPRAVRFIPTQGMQVPTLPIDTFDIQEGAIIGNFAEPVAINTVLGFAYMDGSVPTQLYAASLAGNGPPSRPVPGAKTTHKVLWYQKEGKSEIKPKPKVLKQALDPNRGDKIPPDATVRALFDVAEAELMAQADIARLLTPEDMQEEPITGFPEPRFDKVQPDFQPGGTDFFGQVSASEQSENQNEQVLSKTGESKVNPIANELFNNPEQTIKDLALILGVPLPDNLTPGQINQLKELAKTLPNSSGSGINQILGNNTLSQIVPQLTPPATTPF